MRKQYQYRRQEPKVIAIAATASKNTKKIHIPIHQPGKYPTDIKAPADMTKPTIVNINLSIKLLFFDIRLSLKKGKD